jgi:hypothetical protein
MGPTREEPPPPEELPTVCPVLPLFDETTVDEGPAPTTTCVTVTWTTLPLLVLRLVATRVEVVGLSLDAAGARVDVGAAEVGLAAAEV